MPKSKELIDSDDDLSSNDEKPKKRVKTEKKSTKNGSAAAKDSDGEEQSNKKSNGAASSNSSGGEGKMYMLAKQRFINVSEFRGKPLVNIREYYESNGKTLPGKKGISLSIDQWENLKKNIANIDADIKRY